jgi:hypothetical protein
MQEQEQEPTQKPARRPDTPRPKTYVRLELAALIDQLNAFGLFRLQTESPPPLHSEMQFTSASCQTPPKSSLGKKRRSSAIQVSEAKKSKKMV